jgi:hypothetical protein
VVRWCVLVNNSTITDFTYFTDLGQLPGRFDPLAQRDVQPPIDRLPLAANDPEPVFCTHPRRGGSGGVASMSTTLDDLAALGGRPTKKPPTARR